MLIVLFYYCVITWENYLCRVILGECMVYWVKKVMFGG